MRQVLKSLGRGLLLPALVALIGITLAVSRPATRADAATLRAPTAHAANVHTRVAHRRHAKRRAGSTKHRGVPRAHVASALPQEGIFGDCDLDAQLSVCEQNLDAMHAAGITVDVEAVRGSLVSMAAFGSYAQSIGMSIMWELNDAGFWGGVWASASAAYDFPQFASACGCTGTTQVLDAMIQWLAKQPATYGYYAADDETLTASQRPGLTQYIAEIRAIDPSHMIMVGANASQGTSNYSTGATMGNEIYPVTTSSLMPLGRHQDDWQAVAQSVSQDQRAADRAGTQTAFILQSFTFGDSLADGEAVGVCTAGMTQAQCANLLQFPSAAAQLELRNEVLEHSSPKLILWYNFNATYGQGSRWSSLEQAISAPYPASGSAARAHRAHKARKARHNRRAHHAKRSRRAHAVTVA